MSWTCAQSFLAAPDQNDLTIASPSVTWRQTLPSVWPTNSDSRWARSLSCLSLLWWSR